MPLPRRARSARAQHDSGPSRALKKRAAAKAAREAATTAAVQAAAKAQLTAAKLRSDTPRGGPEPGDDAASQTPSTPDDLADYHAMLEPRARPDPHDELERRYEQAMMTVKMTKDVLRRAVQEERPKASRISSLKKKLKKARKQASDLNTRLKKSQDALLGAGLPPKALRRHQTPSQAQISLWTDEIRAGDITGGQLRQAVCFTGPMLSSSNGRTLKFNKVGTAKPSFKSNSSSGTKIVLTV